MKTWCHEGQKDCYLTGMSWGCGCQECDSEMRPVLLQIRVLKALRTELRSLGHRLTTVSIALESL
jgi:hypothetical protein